MANFSRSTTKNLIIRLASFLLAVALVFSCAPAGTVAFAQSDDLFIHAIYLGSGENIKGDSVLLESGGEYLLMDCGSEASGGAIVNYLNKLGVRDLSVYISHVHSDHRGSLQQIANNFNITTLYLPSTDYGKEYTKQATVYYNMMMAEESAENVFLKTGDTFSFGSATAKVLGPVGSYTESQFTDDKYGDKINHYINNYSLVTMVTGGGVKYLSCGDIEAEEESALLKKYSDSTLKATVYKLSHHGLKTSNTEAFVNTVNATYNFEENCGHDGVTENGYYKTFTCKKYILQNGICIMTGEEKTSFIFHAEGGKIAIFKTSYSQSNILKEWVRLRGADGTNRLYDYYYIGTMGNFYKGVYYIGGKRYYFDTTGKMIIGYYSSGKYIGWRTFNGEYRYFLETGEMYVGFKTIGNYKYYFDYATGYRLNGDKYRTPTKIGSYYYAIGSTGTIYVKGWYNYKSAGGYRYFGSDGAMKTGWLTIGTKQYYLDTTSGIRKQGLQKINNKFYWFCTTNGSAYLCKNIWVQSGSHYRYFNKYGVMTTGWSTIEGKKYFFDYSTGLTKSGFTGISGKYYWFRSDGTLYTSCWKKDKATGNYRRFNSSGIMQTGWYKSGKKMYYLNPVSGFRSEGYTVVCKKNFYFDKTTAVMYVNKWKKYSKSGGYRYYGKSGVMYSGWHTINGKKYYFDKKTGATVSGVKTINGKTYYFNSSSSKHELMKNKWVYYNKGYLYFGAAGVRRSGWATINGKHYYFNKKTGCRATGTVSIDGKSYKFNRYGVLMY